MSRKKRVRLVDRNDPRLVEMARLLSELVDDRVGPDASFEARSAARNEAAAELRRLRLQELRADQDGTDQEQTEGERDDA